MAYRRIISQLRDHSTLVSDNKDLKGRYDNLSDRYNRLSVDDLYMKSSYDSLLEWTRIKGFSTDGRTFGDAKCIPCRIGTISCGIVVPGRTHYPEDIIEVIAPMALRRKLGSAITCAGRKRGGHPDCVASFPGYCP